MSAPSYTLNCPFCGSCATSTVCMPYGGGNAMVALRCNNCRAQGPHEFDEVKARQAWDRRTRDKQHGITNGGGLADTDEELHPIAQKIGVAVMHGPDGGTGKHQTEETR